MAYRNGVSTVATTWTTAGVNTVEAIATSASSTATAASSTVTGDGPSSTDEPTHSVTPSGASATVKDVCNLLLTFLGLLGLWILI